jgi:lipopolysaccharide export system permease protein
VIFDAFSNIDEFTKTGSGVLGVVQQMGWYYAYRTCELFSTVGSLVSVIAAMMVLALVQRFGELNPVLSAGIPTYRLARPILAGTLLINVVLIANQELLIPQIAGYLQMRPGQDASSSDKIQPVYDHSTNILIASGQIFPQARKLAHGEFVLPAGEIASDLTRIQSAEAVYEKEGPEGRSGWLLTGATPRYLEIGLTPLGRDTVFAGSGPDELFIATDISFEELMNRNKSFTYLSTLQLLDRVKNPAYGILSARTQSLHLHTRFSTPFLNMLIVLMVVPLIVRRESRGIMTNLALSLLAIFTMLGIGQVFLYCGNARMLPLDLAAWGPVIVCGTASAWCSEFVRT